MQPVTSAASHFIVDQQWKFEVATWDTPYAVLEDDQSTGGMKLRVVEGIDDDSWATYVAGVKASSAPDVDFLSVLARPVVYDATNRTGRWPLVQAYWGSGAPNWWGVSRARQVGVCFSGTILPAAMRTWLPNSDTLTFAIAGSGFVRIDVVRGVSAPVNVFSGEVSESGFVTDGFGYSDTFTFQAGDQLFVYYLQEGTEPWGGLVVKAIAGTRPADALLEAAAADAPVLSAGLFSQGSPIPATVLPFIVSVNVTHEPGAASKADITVPLVNPDVNDGHGWVYARTDMTTDPGALEVYDGGVRQHTLRRKRLVQVRVARPDTLDEFTPLFTGFVEDFGSGSDGKLQITCTGLEGRQVEQYEQAPDRISYMARGFRLLDLFNAEPGQRAQPVYNVPAFDNWPLAYAVEELAMRAGLDPSRFRKTLQAVQTDGTGVAVEAHGGVVPKFRALSTKGIRLKLPRPVHYGNAGLSFTEVRPFDDEYIFKVEPTKDLWSRARELTDRVGYRYRFDELGDAVLEPANLPTYVVDLDDSHATVGTVTEVLDPSAYGATYLTATAATTLVTTVKASRIDVSFPRNADARPWTVTVRRVSPDEVLGTADINPQIAGDVLAEPRLLFNSAVLAQGGNATVVTVFSGDYDEYEVTLQAITDATGTKSYVDCVLAYAQDPIRSKLPTLSSSETAISVTTRAQQDEVRNKVTIVGRRKAAVTDSEKFEEAQAPADQEFVVANAIDLQSIVNPFAANHVGYQKQTIIYDESITDDGFANYLAQTFIYRQANPIAGTTVEHGLLPMLQPGDPIAVAETRYDTMNDTVTQFVRRVTHSISLNKYRTSIETDSWPSYPSYEPRTDIDLSKFDNRPVTKMTVAYTSISGHKVTNPTAESYVPSRDLPTVLGGDIVTYNNVAVTTVLGQPTLEFPGGASWPPQPGTVQIRANGGVVATSTVTLESEWNNAPSRPTVGILVGRVELGLDTKLGTTGRVYLEYEYRSGGTANILTGRLLVTTNRANQFYYEIQRIPRTGADVIEIRAGSPTSANALENTGRIVRWRAVVRATATTGSNPQWVANNPYHEFFAVNYASPALTLTWKQGDGSARFARPSTTTYDVRYRRMAADADPYAAVDKQPESNTDPYSPFYDPYTSELGETVTTQFDVLADGLYRVSVRSADDDSVVAWLTEPAADEQEPERHWQYLTVGAKRQFKWDGVDQVGEWNATQSELYASLVEGTFEQNERPRIGKGFYVWNQEMRSGTLGDLAVIWTKLNAGKPYIGQGTFGEWYVYIEALTDPVDTELRAIDDQDEDEPELRILTHLPEPTKLELQINDWTRSEAYTAAAGQAATTATVADVSHSVESPFSIGTEKWRVPTGDIFNNRKTMGGYVNNDRPVRVRFRVAQRPGKLWEGNQGEVSVKLTRQAHLRAIIADQTVQYTGTAYPETSVEQRIIANRRLSNDEHTNSYPDKGYRKAKTFRWTDGDAGTTEWIFLPQDFKRAFRFEGLQESIEFGNYLQLEEIPGWNENRGLAGSRARMNFALMSYLFYLSAYVTDRSGRSSWGVNRSFVDKTKITATTALVDWTDDAMYTHRRTVVCRQWTLEPGWKSGQLEKFGASAGSLLDHLLEHWWWQHEVAGSAPSNVLGTAQVAWSTLGLSADPYSAGHAALVKSKLSSDWSSRPRQLPASLGTWSWEANPTWYPSISRDLHPYHLVPSMVVPEYTGTVTPEIAAIYRTTNTEKDLRLTNAYATVETEKSNYVSDNERNEGLDIAAAEVWSSPVFEPTSAPLRFWTKSKVDPNQWPFKKGEGDLQISNATCDYVRQIEWQHWEDLRGMFSRNKRPAEAPVKVAPAGPYYINPYTYGHILTGMARRNPSYPKFHAEITEWFSLSFRTEYVWESQALFPAFHSGREQLSAMNWWRTRFSGRMVNNAVQYDSGAWVGWKDDGTSGVDPALGTIHGWKYASNSKDPDVATKLSPFETGHQPVAVGPIVPQTLELTAHLVLVPERRGVS